MCPVYNILLSLRLPRLRPLACTMAQPGQAGGRPGSPAGAKQSQSLCDCFVACGLLAMTFLVVIPSVYASPAAGEVRKANGFYTKGQFDNALEHYQKALGKDPQSTAIEYDLGTALYKKGDYVQSIEHLQKALLTDDVELQAKAQYNLGNAFYKSGIAQEHKNIKGAIKSLERSLTHYQKVLNRPDKDPDAQYNDEFVKKELERLKKEQQEQKQKQDQQQNQKQDSQNQEDKRQNQSSDQNKKDQSSSKDNAQPQNKEDQGEHSNTQQNKDQNGRDEKNSQGQGEKDKDKNKNNGKPQEANGDQGEKPQEQDSSQGSGDQENGAMTPKEANMTLEDYQRNEEPKGMLYFVPETGKDKPVGKDW